MPIANCCGGDSGEEEEGEVRVLAMMEVQQALYGK